jgi:CRP/FNR family cyclic AMP-dependent transcriptional regulator
VSSLDHRDDLAQVPLFADLSRRQRQALSRGAVRLEVPEHYTLFAEDGEGHEFVVVLDGTVDVLRGDTVVATLGKGDYFGEVALVDHTHRNASAVARTTATVICIGQDEFSDLVSRFPRIARAVHETSANRLPETPRGVTT